MSARPGAEDRPGGLDAETLGEIEALASELARLAGATIVAALGRTLEVSYKGADAAAREAWRDPVSEIDNAVEVLIRARLAERFPEHDIIGEEIDERHGRGHDVVWAIDPVDGTANFVNGFPLFSASIGVVHRGRPAVGALWCSSSHALRAGVYSARAGGELRFDGEPVPLIERPGVKRRLIGLPRDRAEETPPGFEARRTGSAAVECAFVAAGLLAAAHFERPNLWDVAGGVALVQAAGGAILEGHGGGWRPFEAFAPGDGTSEAVTDLALWRRPLLVGDADALSLLVDAAPPMGG